MQEADQFKELNQPAIQVAPRLLGSILEVNINNQIIKAKIVEVEAYDQADEASHSFRGKTQRTEVMFGPPGYLYVYFTYGMHYCCNVVVGPAGYGSAVLIRAVEPIEGLNILRDINPHKKDKDLTNGPAKLCKILGIDKALNGHFLGNKPIKLILKPALAKNKIVVTTRIGINKAQTKPWRFYIKDNPFVSVQ